jgi:hypothetical protein
MKRAVIFIFLVLITLLLSGCLGLRNVQIDKVNNPEITNNDSSEEIPLPNCGGSSPISYKLSVAVSVKQIVEIGGKISADGSGQASGIILVEGVPVPVKGQLKVAVEAAYKDTYDSEQSRVDEITLGAAAQTHVIYIVKWEEQKYESLVSYDYNGKSYGAKYAYILKVPKLSDSRKVICQESASVQEAPVQTTVPPSNATRISTNTTTLCGEPVTPEVLSNCIGGESAYWTLRGPDVWGYWNKGHNTAFRHPGGNMILTYWDGFPMPSNTKSCKIVDVKSEKTKYMKCSDPGAEVVADGIGLHLVDHTPFFSD